MSSFVSEFLPSDASRTIICAYECRMEAGAGTVPTFRSPRGAPTLAIQFGATANYLLDTVSGFIWI
jgi:hypothetical protein